VKPNTAAVIIDSREPPIVQAAVQAACSLVHVTPLTTALTTADFVVRDGCSPPHTVAIERKQVSDMLGSFTSGRLNKQLYRLARDYTHPILLIEGEIKMTDTGKVKVKSRVTSWSHASVQMFLWSVQRSGVNVLYTHDIAATADLVRILARRAGEDGCVAHLEPTQKAV
jgi:ERCC4-type nuclease